MNLRRRVALVALCFLSGCSSSNNSDYRELYRAMRESLSASMGDGRVTRSRAAAIPYASLGYRVGNSPEQILVLATDANGEQLWTSASRIVFNIRNGRVVRTVGLGHDLGGMSPVGGRQIPEIASARTQSVRYTRQEDFPDIPAYGMSISCTLASQGMQTIVILGHGISTARIDEVCRSANGKWVFTDHYWLDPDSGLVWQSLQHIHPELDPLRIVTLRPPEQGG